MRAHSLLFVLFLSACQHAISDNVDLLNTGADNYLVATGDLDGDGRYDLVSIGPELSSGDMQVQTFLAKSRRYTHADSRVLASNPSTLSLGDMNQDGSLDIVIGARDGSVIILQNEGDGLTPNTSQLQLQAEPFTVSLADLDQDGDLDIIASSWRLVTDYMEYSPYVSLIENLGNGQFSSEQRLFVDREVIDVSAGDFDEDGDLDIAALSFKPGDDFYAEQFRIFVLTNDGANTFSISQEIVGNGQFLWPGEMRSMLAVSDITNDARPDLAVLTDDGTLAVFANQGEGNFAQTIERTVVDFVDEIGNPVSLLSGDFDADGLNDLAFTVSDQAKLNQFDNWDYSNCYVVLLLNKGLGDLQVTRAAEMDGFLGGASVGYLDEDNFLDVVVAKTGAGERTPGVYLVHLPGEE